MSIPGIDMGLVEALTRAGVVIVIFTVEQSCQSCWVKCARVSVNL